MCKLIVLLTMLIPLNLHAQSQIFDEFSYFHDWIKAKKIYQIESSFVSQGSTTNIDISTSTLIVTKDSKVIFMKENNSEPILFFNSLIGTWITKEQQPTPLKISGAYSVYGIMNVDDIIGLNYKDTYDIAKVENNIVLLKAKKNNTTYPYVSMKKIMDKQFELIFMDHNQIAIKKGTYTMGIIDNISTISKAVFNDLLIDTNRISSFEIQSINPSKVPIHVLTPERFKVLFNTLK